MIDLISVRYKDKYKGKKKKTDKNAADTTPQEKRQKKSDDPKGTSCFFYEAEGHGSVCSKINLTLVPGHTWWINSGVTTHIKVSMQGCLNCRKPNDCEGTFIWEMARRLKLK